MKLGSLISLFALTLPNNTAILIIKAVLKVKAKYYLYNFTKLLGLVITIKGQ